MNLNSIAGSVISAVSPWVTCSYQQSTGYTQSDDGSQVPIYAAPVSVNVQKQPLAYKDLIQVSGLNINGEKCAFYVNGNWQGVSRPSSQGGDLITLPNGQVWFVVQTLENWSGNNGWSKVCAVLQLNNS